VASCFETLQDMKSSFGAGFLCVEILWSVHVIIPYSLSSCVCSRWVFGGLKTAHEDYLIFSAPHCRDLSLDSRRTSILPKVRLARALRVDTLEGGCLDTSRVWIDRLLLAIADLICY